jgi:hypothetical protein
VWCPAPAPAIAASRAQHWQARTGYERELATVDEQLTAKEAVVDGYLTEYEDNKIDRDTVASRIEKISDQIRHLRHRRDELAFMLDLDAEPPDTSHLTEIRDRIVEIIDTGTGPERKALCEALLAELRIDGTQTATPVIRIPLNRANTPSILQAETRTTTRRAVRACPPSVEPRFQHTNTSIMVEFTRTRVQRSPAVYAVLALLARRW